MKISAGMLVKVGINFGQETRANYLYFYIGRTGEVLETTHNAALVSWFRKNEERGIRYEEWIRKEHLIEEIIEEDKK